MDEQQVCTELRPSEEPCCSPSSIEPEKPGEEELQTLQLLNVLLTILDRVKELESLELDIQEDVGSPPNL